MTVELTDFEEFNTKTQEYKAAASKIVGDVNTFIAEYSQYPEQFNVDESNKSRVEKFIERAGSGFGEDDHGVAYVNLEFFCQNVDGNGFDKYKADIDQYLNEEIKVEKVTEEIQRQIRNFEARTEKFNVANVNVKDGNIYFVASKEDAAEMLGTSEFNENVGNEVPLAL